MNPQDRASLVGLLAETVEAQMKPILEPLKQLQWEMYQTVDAAIVSGTEEAVHKFFRGASLSSRADDASSETNGEPRIGHPLGNG